MRVLPWLILLITACAAHRNSPPATTIHLIRHAEKADGNEHDPALSEKGSLRAKTFAELLEAYPVQAIYTSEYQRTQLTAAPLALAKGVVPKTVPAYAFAELKEDILAHHHGAHVVVVGHTHSIAGIIEALTGQTIEGPTEEQYDRVYRITLQPDRPARIVVERYGEPTP